MKLVNPIQRKGAEDAEQRGEENCLRGFSSVRLFPSIGSTRAGQRGMMLIDCIAYLGLFGLIFGMALMAFYRAHDNSNHLALNTAELIRALNTGERWREDVRTATAPPRLEEAGGESVFLLTHTNGEVRYVWRDGVILRQATPNTNWVTWLPSVKSSVMQREARANVVAWRWEVELLSRKKVPQVRPLLSFQAVARAEDKR